MYTEIHHASAEEHGGSEHRHTPGTRGGLNGGSITSSYRTAKAEARQLEVHGNMEHCLEIVDSSVIFWVLNRTRVHSAGTMP